MQFLVCMKCWLNLIIALIQGHGMSLNRVFWCICLQQNSDGVTSFLIFFLNGMIQNCTNADPS